VSKYLTLSGRNKTTTTTTAKNEQVSREQKDFEEIKPAELYLFLDICFFFWHIHTF
jgi:hypothetical protein